MEKFLLFIAKVLCILCGSFFYIGSLGGLIMCFDDGSSSLTLSIIMTIFFLCLGTLFFFIALKILNPNNISSASRAAEKNNTTNVPTLNTSATILHPNATEQSNTIQETQPVYSPMQTQNNLPLPHYDAILPNVHTIHEQKEIDYNIAVGIYPTGTSDYLGMEIVSSVVPPQENYNILNEQEKKFFQAFHDQLIQEKFSPSKVKLCRLSNGGFNVDYIGLCHVGKINLYQSPVKYAAIKKGNKRATKIFASLQEANEFIAQKADYMIQERKETNRTYMQYFVGLYNVKELHDLDVDQYIEFIIRWIRYLKYCKRN